MKHRLTDTLIDIQSIAYYLKEQSNKEVREFGYKDFISKFNQMKESLESTTDKEVIDVAIITSNLVEFTAFNKLLNITTNETLEYKNISGLKVWKTSLKRNFGRPLNLIFITVNQPGNISCSIACMRIFEHFDVRFAILAGFTAGLVPNYSVIFSEGIIDYEHQRLELNNITFRPDPLMVKNVDIIRSVSYFIDKSTEFKKELIRNVTEQNFENFPTEILDNVNLHFGIIASGSKLLADGITLKKLKQKIPIKKGIIGGEMEGSGFGHSCEEYEIPWIVIKGVSDQGGRDKNKSTNKEFQKVAALASAIATINFLRTEYRTKEDFDLF